MTRACACLGTLTEGPARTVVHGLGECSSTPTDCYGEAVTLVAIGRCPRCVALQAVARGLCSGCLYAVGAPVMTSPAGRADPVDGVGRSPFPQ